MPVRADAGKKLRGDGGGSTPDDVVNLPNTITFSRLVLTAAFVVAVSIGGVGGLTVGLVTFIVAAISDFVDGYLARKLNQVTAMGKLMDPLADKILMAAAYIFLVQKGVCPDWVATVIVGREFLVTGLRGLAVEQGEVIAADRWGKWKTGFQIAFCIAGIILLIDTRWNLLLPLAEILTPPFLWLSFALTVFSGGNYLWKARGLIRSS